MTPTLQLQILNNMHELINVIDKWRYSQTTDQRDQGLLVLLSSLLSLVVGGVAVFVGSGGWANVVVGLKGGFGDGGKCRRRLALNAVGSAAGERQGWLSVLVCSVMEAGGEDDGRDYCSEGWLADIGSR
ncbi:hypothetical protein D5086_021322 [Populus alba]|uniref:Uncharacterized protein n=1 Tax=Populus alba TaxID=43335 RepID=A0ACC4BDB6_POPAL